MHDTLHRLGALAQALTLTSASLISIDWNTLEWTANPQFDLAREMPATSSDGRTYTFKLRDDARWSDRAPITSTDFVFAWENARKPEHGFGGVADMNEIQLMIAPDPQTIVVTLWEQLAPPVALGTVSIAPIPKHVWEGRSWLDPSANPEILKPTVVAGPYLPDEITAGRHSYRRNPNWWGKQPRIDRIEFVLADAQGGLELLRARQVEWVETFPPAQYTEARSIPNANVIE